VLLVSRILGPNVGRTLAAKRRNTTRSFFCGARGEYHITWKKGKESVEGCEEHTGLAEALGAVDAIVDESQKQNWYSLVMIE